MAEDPLLWHTAVQRLICEYSGLSADTQRALASLLRHGSRLKEQMLYITTAAGAGDICASCGGECCNYGRYHVTAADVLYHHISTRELFMPDFSRHPLCPYSCSDGCLMPPAFRPYTCVIFICEAVDALLSEAERTELQALETKLAEIMLNCATLAGPRITKGILL